MALTKSQANKLGDDVRRIAPGDPFPTILLSRLQEFRSSYDAPLVEAQALIRERLRLDTTSRLKTVNTIVEKLRREKTRLAEMQDVAGVRIVIEGGLIEQDSRAHDLIRLFPTARVVDRRSRPSHGYRALHLVPVVSGYPVEVQLRTRLQDLWAQAFERVADRAGRGIRYGDVPPDWTHQVERLQIASEDVSDIEELDRDRLMEREKLKDLLKHAAKRASSGQDVIRTLQLKQKFWEEKSFKLKEEIRARLSAVVEGVEELT
jgi:ppGpp synthetase/RelA/SpoT-type nucleotidyltranferase